MRAETWSVVNAYREKFGRDFCDLRSIKNSDEADLVRQIMEELKKETKKKKRKASAIVEVQEDNEED